MTKFFYFTLGAITATAIFFFSAAIAQRSSALSIQSHHEVPLAIQVAKGKPPLIFGIQIDHELILDGGQVTGNPAKVSFTNPNKVAIVAGDPTSTIKVALTSPLASPELSEEAYKKEIERIKTGYYDTLDELKKATEEYQYELSKNYARLLKTYSQQIRTLNPPIRFQPSHDLLLQAADAFDQVAYIILIEGVVNRDEYLHFLNSIQPALRKLVEADNMLREIEKAP